MAYGGSSENPIKPKFVRRAAPLSPVCTGAARGVYRKPIGPVLRRAYFREPPQGEVRATPLPHNPVDKGYSSSTNSARGTP